MSQKTEALDNAGVRVALSLRQLPAAIREVMAQRVSRSGEARRREGAAYSHSMVAGGLLVMS
ncbi:MAG: hypothetical protein PHU43_01415 [Candidatus Bipolaricaulis sp.]|nr:hypothetical protein [Candidatus Bipolaricaulis sp.]